MTIPNSRGMAILAKLPELARILSPRWSVMSASRRGSLTPQVSATIGRPHLAGVGPNSVFLIDHERKVHRQPPFSITRELGTGVGLQLALDDSGPGRGRRTICRWYYPNVDVSAYTPDQQFQRAICGNGFANADTPDSSGQEA